MSSTAELLSHYGVNMDPGQLNTWLNENGGYADTDLIIWDAIDVLGSPNPDFVGQYEATMDELIDGLNSCYGYIANVRSGTHWVLLTGYAGNGNFYVNDPGFDQATYSYDEMGEISVYH